MRLFFVLGLVILTGMVHVRAQSAYIPYNRDYYHLIDRYEILNGSFSGTFHTGTKPYRRDQLADFLKNFEENLFMESRSDLFNLRYLRQDSWEFHEEEAPVAKKSLGKNFYKTPSDFFYYRDSVFDVHVNPVIYFQGGVETGRDWRFRNTRGVEVRGSIDRKVGFYTFLTSTDLVYPGWVREYAVYNGAVPGEGFWKRYGNEGYSYFSAMAYVDFQATRHIHVQMGQDRNFIGEGYRSLILSDFSNPYMFLKVNTKVWKLDFTNLWAQMNADIIYERGFPTDGRYPQKWFSLHRLGMNLGKRLNIGLFESVMANRLDWNYLNPLIFYRWVEHQLGTPDKVMMGADLKWNLARNMQVYGQFVLDEFVFDEFFRITGRGSRRNKHGVQLGYKYINVAGINNLDWQLEYNQVRPFTYQEKFEYQSFSNYRTPLTHPLGANFREAVTIIRYQPIPRLSFQGTFMYQYFGTDPSQEDNYGGDVLKNRLDNSTALFGNYIGQGDKNHVAMGSVRSSYMLKHNLFLEFSQAIRALKRPAEDGMETTGFGQVSLRLNMARFDHHF
ncbi:hypothetical protein [Negadavirga shengliensis]|uniref:Capsule assembly protein Wzi n=1 Tax=Negadavirga shengliensis TaxID=1389218 RepID=A0ABV9T3P6_9BACT